MQATAFPSSSPEAGGAPAVTLRRIGVFIGAEVKGIDLTQALDTPTVEALKRAHAEYGVLVFPGQKISSEDLKRFGRYFGKLSVHPFSASTPEDPELIIYDNKEGNPPASTDIWHTDETFRECPPMGTALCSKQIPERGGDTAFASMNAVYEGLSDRWQRFLSGLEAVHDFQPFKTLFGSDAAGIARIRKYEDAFPPAVHPVVSVHPVTGKKVIFVNPQFTRHIKGMADDESRMILDMLYRKTLIHEYQYRHRWEPDMVVFWDNRLVQHSALHDYYPQRRVMHRVTVAGTRPVLDGSPADPGDLRRYLMPPLSAFIGTATAQKRQHQL